MLRPSGYIISVKLPDSSETLLVQGYTGATVEIDSEAAASLGFPGENVRHATQAARNADPLATIRGIGDSLVDHLKEGQFLTELSYEEERAHVRALAEAAHKKLMTSRGASFWLVPTYACNLRCSYCYMFSPPSKIPRPPQSGVRMSEQLINAAFEAMEVLVPDNPLNTLLLIGGEPLLRRNSLTIQHIMRATSYTHYKVLIFSNGVEMDSFIPMLTPELVKAVQVTVDGPPEVHNRRRVLTQDRPTFAVIMRNIQAALDNGLTITFRINLDESNIEALPELASIIEGMGWLERSNLTVSAALTQQARISPRVVADFLEHHSAQPSLRSIVFNRSAEHMVRSLLRDGQFQLRTSYCAREVSAFVFDPLGNIYDCPNTIGYEAHRIGKYGPGKFELYSSPIEFSRNRIVTNIPECSACEFLFLCGGGCSTQSTEYQSINTYRPHCAGTKESIVGSILEIYPRLKSFQFLCKAKQNESIVYQSPESAGQPVLADPSTC